MLSFYIIALVVFMAVLGTNIHQYIKDMIRYEKFDSPMLLLMMAVTLNLGHIMF